MALPNDKITTTLVANTLESSSRDVGTLCTHDGINWLSVNKPTSYPSVVTNDWAKGVINQNYFDGIENYGINKPAIIKPGNIPNPSSAPTYFVGDTLNVLNNYWSYIRPTGGSSSPYRLGDFRGYEHSIPTYPFTFTNFPLTAYGSAYRDGSSLNISAFIRYNLDDYSGNLGLKNIFDLTSGSNAPIKGLFWGILARTTNRNNVSSLPSCGVIGYGNKLGDYDPVTGSNSTQMIYFTVPLSTAQIINGSAQPNIFHIGERIELVPFIAGYGGSTDAGGNPHLRFFGLKNTLRDTTYVKYTIPISSPAKNTMQITNVTFTVVRGAAPNYPSGWSLIYLDNLNITISKPPVEGTIFLRCTSNLQLSPTSAVGIGEVQDGTLPTAFELLNSGTTQVLDASIITNRGSTPPYRPYIVVKTNAAIDITLSFSYLKYETENTYIAKTITVPAI